MHLLPEILLCVAEEKQPPILGEPSNSSWTSIWQCVPFSPMIQRIQGKPASAVDIPAPMAETSAGVCPELPPPFYLFKTPQFTFLVLLHYSLSRGILSYNVGTFNAWQQDKLLHKTQLPLPHLLNTQAQADTHTHKARIYVDREDPKILQPFLYKENGGEGTMKVSSFPPSKNQFKLNHSWQMLDRLSVCFKLNNRNFKILENVFQGQATFTITGVFFPSKVQVYILKFKTTASQRTVDQFISVCTVPFYIKSLSFMPLLLLSDPQK